MTDYSKVWLAQKLGITYPIIMAPMFLVTDVTMMVAALNSGITAAIPAANARSSEDLRKLIQSIKAQSNKPFGVNIITNKSNILQHRQLQVCVEEGVSFIITSLGSPLEVIKAAKEKGILVFCDVVDLKFAQKVAEMGADAIIAVNRDAGGHSGVMSKNELLEMLKSNVSIPVISAGGVSNAVGFSDTIALGADGLSIGTVFIASTESPVSEGYKNACIEFGAKDIVMTTKLSGTPCTVINTPYVQKIGTEQNWLEKLLQKNKRLKKWMKAFVFLRGMKKLQKAAFSTTYQSVWCAGKSIENVTEVLPIKVIVDNLVA
jgi:nitronate monooxygenase